jgi:hypothetical protein
MRWNAGLLEDSGLNFDEKIVNPLKVIKSDSNSSKNFNSDPKYTQKSNQNF